VGLQRCCVFWAASKQPNGQLRCLLPTTYEIGGSSRREKARIDKSQRNRVPSRQREVSHIFSNTYEIIGWEVMLHPLYSLDLAPSDYHLFQSFLNGKKFSNDDDLKSHLDEFFADRTRSSMSAGSWSYQKDGKRSSNRIKTQHHA